MSKVTDVTGAQAESFDLIMRKEFAYQIIDGVKKLEFRALSDFYVSRYLRKLPDGMYKWKDEIQFLHFHDYNNSWFLDVHIEPICLKTLHPDSADFFHHYGHYELDEDMKEFAKYKNDDDNVPGLFCIPIDAIVNTNLEDLDEIRKINVQPVLTIAEAVEKFKDRHR